MDEVLRARYGSATGAAAYAKKYEGSMLRRWSSRRESALVTDLVERVGGRGGHVVDVPCAAGRLVRPLLSVAASVTAVDASPAMVEVASAALAAEVAAGRAVVRAGRAEALPLRDGEADVVVCWRLLHHLLDPLERAAILRETARVARRGVVLSFADRGTLKARMQAARRRDRRCAKLTLEEVAREAAAAGLSLVAHRRLSSAFSLVAGAAFAPAR